ncbi:protein PLASTID REDOX INSENSITIVE 2, chloroplastic-like [Ipomoea triloba]|uniref:protein PLASTID REDOX INSENSITIVE 2, chloroplastic-like n=1 Tax=Ipomoea triloba TaxID=35885 RepID=UPI00125E936F|nr:protein PLASTID REDOX INSENSITIVE 2, chloroplastic-like [Ipomoea triloba]
MASPISTVVSPLLLPSSSSSSVNRVSASSPLLLSSSSSSSVNRISASSSFKCLLRRKPINVSSSRSRNRKPYRLVCRAAEYKFPDPIPEFAEAETDKFRNHLLERLPRKKDIYGDSIEEIVCICSEILNNFLHTEYGGPGTLLVTPFIDMADTIADRELPGAPQAARTAVKWAQKHVDNDWKAWNSSKSC